jgi:inner membrane protein
MKSRLRILFKVAMIFIVSMLLLIPLAMISSQVYERNATQQNVRNSFASESGDEQSITGPILTVPFTRTRIEKSTDDKGKEVLNKIETVGTLTYIPKVLDITGELALNDPPSHRGMYEARYANLTGKFSGAFSIPAHFGISAEHITEYAFEPAILSVGLGEIRGLHSTPNLTWQGKNLPFQPTSHLAQLKTGIHAILPILNAEPNPVDYPFVFDFSHLDGLESFSFTPIGESTQIKLHSTWQHPSIIGGVKVESLQVEATGFNALWKTTALSTGITADNWSCQNASSKHSNNAYTENLTVVAANEAADTPCPSNLSLGVRLVNPVDQYTLLNRATKYGLLFIIVTFAGFFLFEILKQLRIHPIQYILVGLSLVLFFLLLLSFSEHLPFKWAYVLSTMANIIVLSAYLHFVLKSIRRALGFSVILMALYGALFVLLQSEDYALLLGSLLLFGLLSLMMLLTRKIDWYNLELSTEEEHKIPNNPTKIPSNMPI